MHAAKLQELPLIEIGEIDQITFHLPEDDLLQEIADALPTQTGIYPLGDKIDQTRDVPEF